MFPFSVPCATLQTDEIGILELFRLHFVSGLPVIAFAFLCPTLVRLSTWTVQVSAWSPVRCLDRRP